MFFGACFTQIQLNLQDLHKLLVSFFFTVKLIKLKLFFYKNKGWICFQHIECKKLFAKDTIGSCMLWGTC